MVLGPIAASVLEFSRCATRAERGVGDSAAESVPDLNARDFGRRRLHRWRRASPRLAWFRFAITVHRLIEPSVPLSTGLAVRARRILGGSSARIHRWIRLSPVAEPPVYGAMSESGIEGKNRPNQALQPTATAVMHPADAGCPPAVAVADL